MLGLQPLNRLIDEAELHKQTVHNAVPVTGEDDLPNEEHIARDGWRIENERH
ncbi:hypothetical protein D3C86_2112760 [compost metagenome]